MNKNRKLRLMSWYVEIQNDQRDGGANGKPRWTPTRAATEPMVMLEKMAAKHLEAQALLSKGPKPVQSPNKQTKMEPTAMIEILKDRLVVEEEVFRFDLLTLNQRCIELLRQVQKICIDESPLDYDDGNLDISFRGDKALNGIFSFMLAGEAGLERHQPSRFKEACGLVEELIATKDEGMIESKKAKI